MLDAIIRLAGLWFAVAVGLQALAVFFEQAGSARSPEEEKPHGLGVLFMGVAALLTPGLLLAHAYFSTHEVDPNLRIAAIGAVIASVLGGALLGALFGAVARGTAAVMRMIALPASLIALAVAIYATLPTIQLLIEAARNGGVIYTN